jgi:hypothetical protein
MNPNKTLILLFLCQFALSSMYSQDYETGVNFEPSDATLSIEPILPILCDTKKGVKITAICNKPVTEYIWSMDDPSRNNKSKIIGRGTNKKEITLYQPNDNYHVTVKYKLNGNICSANLKFKLSSDALKSNGILILDAHKTNQNYPKISTPTNNIIIEKKLSALKISQLSYINPKFDLTACIHNFIEGLVERSYSEKKSSAKAIVFSDYCQQNLDLQSMISNVLEYDFGLLFYLSDDYKLYYLNFGDEEQPVYFDQDVENTLKRDITAKVTNACSSKSLNGAIDLNIKGGVSPYMVDYYNVSNKLIYSTTVDIMSGKEDKNNLGPGSYYVVITDHNCNAAKLEFNILSKISISGKTEPIFDGNSGEIKLESENYQYRNSYTYKWSNGSTTKNLTAIPKGNYTVTVSSGVCSDVYTFTIDSQK